MNEKNEIEKTIERCMIYANVSEFVWPFEKRLSG